MKKNLLFAAVLVVVAGPAAAQMPLSSEFPGRGFPVTFGQNLIASAIRSGSFDGNGFAREAAIAPSLVYRPLAEPQRWQFSLSDQKTKKAGDIDWEGLLADQMRVDGIMHLFRFTMEPTTREKILHTRYLDGYIAAVEGYFTGRPRWEDGDPFVGNNVNHPLMGAISSHVYSENDRRCKDVLYGDRQYWGCLTRATVFSAIASVSWEWNPLMSESALGNVGRHRTCVNGTCRGEGGWSDFVMTPAGGLGIRLAGDIARARLWPVLDRHLSDTVAARVLKTALKVVTDPGRLAACAFSADFRGALSARPAKARR